MDALVRIRTTFLFLFYVCVLATLTVNAEPYSDISILRFSIDEQGKVSAEVEIILPQSKFSDPSSKQPLQKKPSVGAAAENPPKEEPQTNSYGLWVVILPIALDDNSSIKAPTDIRVSTLAKGQGYTLLVLVSPPSASRIRLEISGISTISETSEGKGKFEFDLSYGLMSEGERNILTLKNAVSSFEIQTILPKKYQETEIGFSPPLITTTDYQTFYLSSEKAKQEKVGKAWIVFPNPMRSELETAKLVFSIILGVFTLLVHVPALKERRLSWSLVVFLLSAALLTITAYFTYVLSKRLDFMVFAAAAIPHAIYGLVATIYLLVAKKFQATIAGNITVGGAASQYVEARLMKIEDDQQVEKKHKDVLKEGGQYTFNIWQSKQPGTYKIIAKSKITEQRESPVFQVVQGETHPVPLIDLPFLPVVEAPDIHKA